MTKLTDNEFQALKACLNYDHMETQLDDNFSNGTIAVLMAALGWDAQQVGGLISSMDKKSLGFTVDDPGTEAETYFALTETGIRAVFAEIDHRAETARILRCISVAPVRRAICDTETLPYLDALVASGAVTARGTGRDTMYTIPTPGPMTTTAALQVLAEVKAQNGRYYKQGIRWAWMNGNYQRENLAVWSGKLQTIRNQFGPAWLVKAQPTKTA